MAAAVGDDAVGGVAWARALHAALARHRGADVQIADVERAFGFEWTPRLLGPLGAQQTHDPLLARAWTHLVDASMVELLSAVDAAVARLPGLAPSERGAFGERAFADDAARRAAHACGELRHALVPPLCERAATPDAVARLHAAVDGAYANVAREAHARLAPLLAQQTAAVRALQRLCAAAATAFPNGSDGFPVGVGEHAAALHHAVADGHDALRFLAHRPPAALLVALEERGVPFDELRAGVAPRGAFPHSEGGRGAPPASGAVRQTLVADWLAAHGAPTSEACLATLNELRVLSARAPNWRGWDGVGVWARESEPARAGLATGGVGAVAPCPQPAHTHRARGLALVAHAAGGPNGGEAVRAVRVARVLFDLVHGGALAPGSLRADVLAPIAARLAAEAEVRGGPPPLLGPLSGEAAAVGETAAPLPPTRATPAGDAPTARLGKTPTLRDATRVPRPLLRDFVLLAAFGECLDASATSGGVAIATVVEHLETLAARALGEPVASLLAGSSRASLRQTAGHVLKKLVDRLVGARGAAMADEVGYGRMPEWARGGVGVTTSRAGHAALRAFLAETLGAFVTDADGAAGDWHASRSARWHAGRKAGA